MQQMYMNSKFELFTRKRFYYNTDSVKCSSKCSKNINGKVSTYDKTAYNSPVCLKCGSKMVAVKNYYTKDIPLNGIDKE